MKKVAVFFGGKSVEHEVSIITGVLTLNAVDKTKFNPIPLFVNEAGEYYTGDNLFDIDFYKNINYKLLKRVALFPGDNKLYAIHNKKKGGKFKPLATISVAINCMHGERGEDGCIAGLLKLCNIPFASPDLLGSAVCMDKYFSKKALKGLNVKTLEGIRVSSKQEFLSLGALPFDYPIIIKPNCLGSSIGIKRADNEGQALEAISKGLRYGSFVEIEPYLTNFYELNSACFRDFVGNLVVSPCEKPVGKDQILSFDDKYVIGQREFPANIDKSLSDRIKDITKTVYQEFNFEGIIRIDYIIANDTIYLNEINTVPGSLSYYLFSDTVKGFSGILNEVLGGTLRRNAKRQTDITTVNSGILSGFGSKGAKRLKK